MLSVQLKMASHHVAESHLMHCTYKSPLLDSGENTEALHTVLCTISLSFAEDEGHGEVQVQC